MKSNKEIKEPMRKMNLHNHLGENVVYHINHCMKHRKRVFKNKLHESMKLCSCKYCREENSKKVKGIKA